MDIKLFFELLDNEWEGAVKRAAKPYAEELFEERKHTFMSKNSTNAKMEAIRKQIEKANNQFINIQESFNNLCYELSK